MLRSPVLRAALATLVAGTALALAPEARAEIPNPALYVGVYGGGNLVFRDWDLGANDHQVGYTRLPVGPLPEPSATTALLPTHSALVGGRLGFQFTPHLALEGEVAYLPMKSTAGGDNQGLAWDVNLLVHLLTSDWTPVLEAGGGAYHNLGGDLGVDADPRLHVGVGVRGMITSFMALRADVRDVISDGFDAGGSNNLELTAGLDFFAWKGEGYGDRDKDGIRDRDDACPDQAGLASLKGCPDGDGDGVADKDDKCPSVPGLIDHDGCPADKDGDGVPDAQDQCVDVPAGAIADAKKPGCPADKDGDGVIDEKDQCVDVAAGKMPDAKRAGCPSDKDGDGVIDEKDQCVDVPAGAIADPNKAGCPNDKDGDGVIDEKDQCVDVPAGKIPDAKKPGCPSDKDDDRISDEVDACPDQAGAPDPDPKKNGCPGLVLVKGNQILILDQVYFATGKDTILPKSTPVLTSVAHAIKTLAADKHIRVEGHTDNKGKAKDNLELSQKRADSVKKWLVEHGIAADRLEAKGWGQEKPIESNDNEKGRAKNRRVEFHIAEPAK
jgi:outer membrane protein OmpA-like peptidoglycan-associated protein